MLKGKCRAISEQKVNFQGRYILFANCTDVGGLVFWKVFLSVAENIACFLGILTLKVRELNMGTRITSISKIITENQARVRGWLL